MIKKINKIRRRLMGDLTQRIGKNHFSKRLKQNKPREIKKILLLRPNHRLGNNLLTTPLVQEIETLFPHAQIDLFSKGGAAIPVFENYKVIAKLIRLPRKPFSELWNYIKIFASVRSQKYDLSINGTYGSSSGKILTYLSSSYYKVYGDSELPPKETPEDAEHMAKGIIYNLRYFLKQLGIKQEFESVPNLDVKLKNEEINKGKEILSTFVKNPEQAVAIYTFATDDKCYSKEWWGEFYSEMKREFNAENIFEILPIENVSQIDFKAPHYYSKDIREIASVLANVSIFVTGDCGIMHLGSASGANTIGLFSTTNPYCYGPYNGKSAFINTQNKTPKEIFKELKNLL